MWYEIQTDTTECTDEVDGVAAGADKDEFAGIGAIEAKNPERKTRFNVRRSPFSSIVASLISVFDTYRSTHHP